MSNVQNCNFLSLQSDIIIVSILSQQCNQKTFTIFFLKKDYQLHNQQHLYNETVTDMVRCLYVINVLYQVFDID